MKTRTVSLSLALTLLTASPLLAQGMTGSAAGSQAGSNPPAPGPTLPFSCTSSLLDPINGLPCLEASRTAVFGMLYPLSENLFVEDATGRVGMGTTSPDRRLSVSLDQANEGLATFDNRNSAGFSGVYFEENGTGRGWVGHVNSGSVFGAPGTMQVGAQFGDFVVSASPDQFFIERMRVEAGGDVGIGTTNPTQQLDIGNKVQMDSNHFGEGSGTITATTGAGNTYGYMGPIQGGNHMVGTIDINGFVSGGVVYDANTNQSTSFAQVKNFRETNPLDPTTDIVYACVEGPEAAAYVRGTATLENGRAFIHLPEHFASVATAPGMTVHVTPRSTQSRGLAVVDRSTTRIEVAELMNGQGNYDFDWEVKAVRVGYEDYEVVRPKLRVPEKAQDSAAGR